jgi:hypothetical protein
VPLNAPPGQYAIAAGLRFEKDPPTQEGLDEVLADQVKAEPRLLPLLEFALDELYKQRSADGLLTFEAYRVHLGGSIVRALAKRADATLEGLSELHRVLYEEARRHAGRAACPSVVIMDGQSDRMTAEHKRGLTPLVWGHVNPYGLFRLDMNTRLAIPD